MARLVPKFLLFFWTATAAVSAGEMVPFVIPADFDGNALVAARREAAFGAASPRVVARDGHFYRGDRRYRAWGVNLCFGANFPVRADAARVAERLAAGGINSVRLHHMDMQVYPGGIWDAKDPTKLSPEALDRLDFFIDQLARRGISVNLNLHVSRAHSRYLPALPKQGRTPDMDKMIDIFTPELIDAQKRYARDLLTRVNAVRRTRYADDPAIAFVEITNEDSLFMWGAENTLQSLPAHYASLLQKLYNAWLLKRHADDAGLKKAWSVGAEPAGTNQIADGAFATLAGAWDKRRWHLEQHEGCAASAAPLPGTPGAVRIDVTKADGTEWHVQFKQPAVHLKKGQYYTLSFRGRADKPRSIGIAAGQDHAPWQGLGLARQAKLNDRWTDFRFGFTATDNDDNARISFMLAAAAGRVELAAVELRTGGQVGLAAGESAAAGTVALFGQSEVDARTLDHYRFLAETEKAYFDAMRKYVRDDLGCKALVTGTIVFGALGLYAQSDMDFVDQHAYWHHPHFPRKQWDMGDWLVEQKPMVDSDLGTLPHLAASRLAGKPFTVTEYNHPAPQDGQAECVPMIASFAATQDWDGVWIFSYCHRGSDQWKREYFDSFFDIDANPAKFGFMPAGAAIFRDAGIEPMKLSHTLFAGGGDVLTTLANWHRRTDRDLVRVFREQKKPSGLDRTYISLMEDQGPDTSPPVPKEYQAPLGWMQIEGERTQFRAIGPAAVVRVRAVPDASGKGLFRAATLTSMDARPLAQSKRMLLTVCGRCENTNMIFSADRRTVGRNWGGPPVRIESLDHTFAIPGRPGETFTLQPLGPDGKPAGAARKITLDSKREVLAPASDATMWWVLTRN